MLSQYLKSHKCKGQSVRDSHERHWELLALAPSVPVKKRVGKRKFREKDEFRLLEFFSKSFA